MSEKHKNRGEMMISFLENCLAPISTSKHFKKTGIGWQAYKNLRNGFIKAKLIRRQLNDAPGRVAPFFVVITNQGRKFLAELEGFPRCIKCGRLVPNDLVCIYCGEFIKK